MFHQVADQQVSSEECSMETEILTSKGAVINGSTHSSAMLEDIEGLRSAIHTWRSHHRIVWHTRVRREHGCQSDTWLSSAFTAPTSAIAARPVKAVG